jgi:hypothetical protein
MSISQTFYTNPKVRQATADTLGRRLRRLVANARFSGDMGPPAVAVQLPRTPSRALHEVCSRPGGRCMCIRGLIKPPLGVETHQLWHTHKALLTGLVSV